MLLAIDPGTHQSGWCILDGRRVVTSGVTPNENLLAKFTLEIVPGSGYEAFDDVAIEMIASYGMPVGAEVFETCVWIGRFAEAWRRRSGKLPTLIYRQTVKLHLCANSRAKDPHVRQALLDLFGPPGTKKAPGPTYGVTSHAWAALAVGATHLDLRKEAPALDAVA